MKLTVVVTRVIFSFIGIALLALGLLFWSGRSLSLVPLHMLLGVLFVLCMWLLSGLAFYARAARGLALGVLAWGIVVPVVGMEQLTLLPGSLHWVVQAVHLLVGLIALGLGHALSRKILGSRVESPGLASA